MPSGALVCVKPSNVCTSDIQALRRLARSDLVRPSGSLSILRRLLAADSVLPVRLTTSAIGSLLNSSARLLQPSRGHSTMVVVCRTAWLASFLTARSNPL